jgi:hypothetical protein
METLILRSKNKEYLSILKAMAKALNVEVESEENPYDPAFVAKIRQSEVNIKDGKVATMTLDELQELYK